MKIFRNKIRKRILTGKKAKELKVQHTNLQILQINIEEI